MTKTIPVVRQVKEMMRSRITVAFHISSPPCGRKKMNRTKKPSARRLVSSSVMSSSGCVRTFPSQNKMNTHNNQLKLNEVREKVNSAGRKINEIKTPRAIGKKVSTSRKCVINGSLGYWR